VDFFDKLKKKAKEHIAANLPGGGQAVAHSDEEEEKVWPDVDIILAYWEPDGFYYPAEAHIPSLEEGETDVHFLDGQVGRLSGEQCMFFGDAVVQMRFQGDWQKRGLYYNCVIEDWSDDVKQFFLLYEDGHQEWVHISQLRASFNQ
jgi:hypothetical protein